VAQTARAIELKAALPGASDQTIALVEKKELVASVSRSPREEAFLPGDE